MTRRTTAVAAITVAALAAVGVLSALTIQSSYDSNLAAERSKLVATAQVTAELMAQQMIGVKDLEQATLERPGFIAAIDPRSAGGFNVAQMQPVLDQLQALRPEIQFAAVSDVAGTIRVTAPADPTVIGTNFAYRDWYRGVMRTGQTYVSTAYVSAVKGAPLVVAVAVPIREPAPATSPGQLVGVLFVGYKIGSVQTFTGQLAELQQIDLQLTDQAGVILAQRGGISGHLASAAGTPLVAAALQGRATALTSASTIAAAVPVPGLGWTLSASTPIAATAAASQQNTSALIAAALLVVLGIAGIALVVTTSRLERAKARHAASETELRTVHHALTEAVHVYDSHGTLVSRNAGAERIFQVDGDWTPEGVDSRWELLREDGSPMPAAERPVEVAMRTGEPSERVVMGIRRRTDMHIKWLSVSTVPIRGARSEVSGYVSCSRDITERIQTIRELGVISHAAQLLSASLDADEVAYALTTSAAELCSAPGDPRRRAQLLVIDWETMTLTGEHDPEGPAKSDGASLPIAEHPYIQQVLATGEPAMAVLDYDEFGPHVADVMRNAQIKNCVWVPLRSEGGVTAVLAVAGRQHALITMAQLERLRTLVTIAELALRNAAAHEQAAAQALTDPLTAIANRRALDDRLKHLPRLRFALVVIDVDNLKTVNDAYGHDAGDELLVGVAAAMHAEIRPGDLLARMGGDEFVAVLVDCSEAGAVQLGSRLANAVSRLRFSWGTTSISFGSAAGEPAEAPEAVVKAADRRLYAAKHGLGGRVATPTT